MDIQVLPALQGSPLNLVEHVGMGAMNTGPWRDSAAFQQQQASENTWLFGIPKNNTGKELGHKPTPSYG